MIIEVHDTSVSLKSETEAERSGTTFLMGMARTGYISASTDLPIPSLNSTRPKL